MQNEMGRKQLIAVDLRGVCLIYLAIAWPKSRRAIILLHFFFLFVYSNILFIAHMRATIEANPKPIDNDDFIANVATSSAIITVAIEGS